MKSTNRQTGNKGEDLAVKYLKNKGYRILERNFHTRFGEIDIICQKDHTLVFVEVKTKVGHQFGTPEEMINQNKIQRIYNMSQIYLKAKVVSQTSSQIDIIAITLNSDHSLNSLHHYQSVY